MRDAIARAWLWLGVQAGWLYVAAFALVGAEMFELVLGVSAAVPELAPVMIAVLALVYVVRRRARRPRPAEAQPSVPSEQVRNR